MANLTDKELDELQEEADFLASYDLSRYPAKGVTADILIFTIRDNKLQLLMIERGGHPFKGKLALPGGFVDNTETLEEAAYRELMEETNISPKAGYLEQLKTYGGPDRDPRGYITSVAWVAIVPNVKKPKRGDDARSADFYPVDELLDSGKLAFDHETIIRDGLERIRGKLEYTPLAHKFLKEKTFTMSEFREVYEIILGKKVNRSNFHRKALSTEGMLIPTGEKRRSATDGGRLSELYRVGKTRMIYPPFQFIKH